MNRILLALLFLLVTQWSLGQGAQTYQQPPAPILDLVNAAPTPSTYIDRAGKNMILLQRDAFISLAEVAQEEYRLAGLRINPRNMGGSREYYYSGMTVRDIATGKEKPVTGLPEDALLGNLGYDPEQKYLAFTNSTPTTIQLWVLDIATAKAEMLIDKGLSDVMGGSPFQWWPDGKGMLVRMVANDDLEFFEEEVLPVGPVVTENNGAKAPNRTYQDLLKTPADEANFDYFTTSRLVDFDLATKTQKPFGDAGLYRYYSISPDGQNVLTLTIQKPYSYLVPYYRFPFDVQVKDRSGKLVTQVYSSPLLENLPKGFDATSKGPRNYSWRSDKPAVLVYTQALDGGDPKNEVDHRDALYELSGNFSGKARELVRVTNRLSWVQWGNDELAIVHDSYWKTRRTKSYAFNPAKGSEEPAKVLFDRSRNDYYGNPGSFVTKRNELGRYCLAINPSTKGLYLSGQGYSPEGNRPFIDGYDLKSGKSNRLWQADGKTTYESVTSIIDVVKGKFITRVEAPDQNPNYHMHSSYRSSKTKAITNFPHPYASIKGISKERLRYTRKDGVELSATLYLPEGYDKEKDGPLPCLMWAYPREYKDSKQAGQVKESPHRFIRLYYGSAIYWVAQGYAVLDNTDFPIIGEGEDEPNDSFIEQLVLNAEAAIDYTAEMGVVDRDRVAVGGHSYGAFMTANLLAHSDLFAAGIARSGAYNRTLTPFGFQAEERTFWEAKDVYMTMSPFMHADKVNEPLLLIHGMADNNSGTYPMQSERYYNALKGHGATARLVMLPHESHGYRARENIYHMLWEMDQWLDKHVKNRSLETGDAGGR